MKSQMLHIKSFYLSIFPLSILVFILIIFGLSCSSKEMVSVESSNKKIVKQWLEEGWNNKNAKIFFGLLSDNFMNHCTGRNLKKMRSDLNEYFGEKKPSSMVIIKDIIAEGNKVALRLTHKSQEQELEKKEKSELVLCILSESKITDVWNSFYNEYSQKKSKSINRNKYRAINSLK